MNVGAHVRGGGQLVPSLEYGVEIGATSIQVFTQSPRMWKPSQYAPDVLAKYRDAQAAHPTITDTFCHATYLINLASAELELYEKSVDCLTHNLSVARGMGASGLVLHVGSHKGAGFDDVVRQIAIAFERALANADPAPEGVADCPILIENAAGSGGTVGRSFEEIEFLIDACNGDDRLGLCIDTQHLWASGFDYSSVAGAERLVKEVDRIIGIKRLGCLHFNDSKIELGGNRDRHANIGEGTIGAKGLAPLVGHPLIRNLPLLLEVPGDGEGPRAEDVAAGKKVVEAGIKLYDGGSSRPSHAPTARNARKASRSSTAGGTPPKKTVQKRVKKAVKKTVKTAAKKVAARPKPRAASKSVAPRVTKVGAKATAKKTPAKKATVKKTTANKATARKTPTKKSSAKKTPTKKTPAKKTPAKKSPTKKTAKKK